MKCDSGIQNGNNLRAICHSLCEEDDGYKQEQRRKQSWEVGDEVDVVFRNDFPHGNFIIHEIFQLLYHIKYNGNKDEQSEREEECSEEFFDDVDVESFEH